MTVQTDLARVDYLTNGTTDTFAVPFPFIADTDLYVILVDLDTLDETVLVLTTDYEVEGEGEATGEIVTTAIYVTGSRLTIIRRTPITQLSDYAANESLPAETVEDDYDKGCMIDADLYAMIGRCLRFSDAVSSDADPILPIPSANMLLGWRSDELGLENFLAADFSDYVVSEFIDYFLRATDREDAVDRLGVVSADDLGPLATITPPGTGFLRDDLVFSEELNSLQVGYRRTDWTQKNANYGLVLADYTLGRGLRKDSTATPTWTIPANGTVPYPIGTLIPLCNVGASGDVTLDITTDTLQRAGGTTTGPVTLEPGFIGAVEKVNTTHWVVFGSFP